MRAIDLACGTGANVRYLAGRLPVSAAWTLVDHDQALLDEARRRLRHGPLGDDYTLTARRLDLSQLDAATVAGHDLVTASALLDLVSAAWIQALAQACRAADAVVLLALTVDGRVECTPPHPDDELVRGLVLRHQRHDKGFGPALGPDAASVAEACFATEGFAVRTAHSDWVLESPRLQRELVEGWARAAAERSTRRRRRGSPPGSSAGWRTCSRADRAFASAIAIWWRGGLEAALRTATNDSS